MNRIELVKMAKRALHGRGRFYKGVSEYIPELVEQAEFAKGELNTITDAAFYARLLNGSDSWRGFSENGNSLIYSEEIAARFFHPHDVERLRKKQFCVGNDACAMLHLQARALDTAADALMRAFRALRILDDKE